MGHADVEPWELSRISMQFWFKDKRRRDLLNAVAAMKSAIDGIVDAGLMVDDDWQHMRVGELVAGVDRCDPRVQIQVDREA